MRKGLGIHDHYRMGSVLRVLHEIVVSLQTDLYNQAGKGRAKRIVKCLSSADTSLLDAADELDGVLYSTFPPAGSALHKVYRGPANGADLSVAAQYSHECVQRRR